jgi:hypothetical protein
MIFSDEHKRRGRLTAPERLQFAAASRLNGVDVKKELSESDMLSLVLTNLIIQAPENSDFIDTVLQRINAQ